MQGGCKSLPALCLIPTMRASQLCMRKWEMKMRSGKVNVRLKIASAAALAVLGATTMVAAQGYYMGSGGSAPAWTPPPPSFVPKIQETKPTEDPLTCNIDEKMVDNWIERNWSLSQLQKTFERTYFSWDKDEKDGGVPLELFGPKGRTDREAALKQAKQELGDAGVALRKLARRYATRQFPSCDQCYEFAAWGKLAWIAATNGGGGVGTSTSGDIYKNPMQQQDGPPQITPIAVRVNIRDLTLAQVTNLRVIQTAQQFLAFADEVNRAQPGTPANPSNQKWREDAEKCNASVQKGVVDRSVCTKPLLEPYLNHFRNLVVDALQAVPPGSQKMEDRWKARSPRLACQSPGTTDFDEIDIIRLYYR